MKIIQKTSSQIIASFSDMSMDLEKLAKVIDQRQGTTGVDLYLLALGKSLLGQIYNINDELNWSLDRNFLDGLSKLRLSIDNLLVRIDSHTSDPATLRILNEGRPH